MLRSSSLLLKTGLKLPDISALNGTAIDNVAEFDGLTVTDVPAIAAPAAAYSVRLLDTAVGVPTYTGAAMRVRRETGTGNDGNDDEADVGFDSNNELSLESPVSNFSAAGSNATTLGEFLNVGTVNSITYTDADSLSPNTAAAYVDEWKDQSGNGNDAEQTTPTNQPQIHNGTVDTDLITENGKPALNFPNPGAMTNLTLAASSGQKVSMFNVASISGGSLGFMMHTSEVDGYRLPIARSGNSNAPADGVGSLSFFNDGSSVTVTTRGECYTEYVDSTQHIMTVFGTLSTAITAGNTNTFGGRAELDTAYPVNGPIQEITIYYGATDQSSNRTAIETNINDFFSIY